MSKIVYIRQAKNNLLLGINTEGECCRYTVGRALYASLGSPAVGEELNEECLYEIKYSDELYRARRKALSLLSLADNNERTLLRKLTAYGISRDTADEVVREMVGHGYINERAQLERLILSEANHKLTGPKKLLPKLVAKGYSRLDVQAIITELAERGELDFAQNAARLIEKKLGDDSSVEEKNKLLYKFGYKIC